MYQSLQPVWTRLRRGFLLDVPSVWRGAWWCLWGAHQNSPEAAEAWSSNWKHNNNMQSADMKDFTLSCCTRNFCWCAWSWLKELSHRQPPSWSTGVVTWARSSQVLEYQWHLQPARSPLAYRGKNTQVSQNDSQQAMRCFFCLHCSAFKKLKPLLEEEMSNTPIHSLGDRSPEKRCGALQHILTPPAKNFKLYVSIDWLYLMQCRDIYMSVGQMSAFTSGVKRDTLKEEMCSCWIPWRSSAGVDQPVHSVLLTCHPPVRTSRPASHPSSEVTGSHLFHNLPDLLGALLTSREPLFLKKTSLRWFVQRLPKLKFKKPNAFLQTN